MNTAAKTASLSGPYVTRDACEAIHGEQREANRRTWEELRGLRRLVIMVVLGGQLFVGGVNMAGLAWWLEEHGARPHAGTVEMVEAARAEAREDVRELRREVRDFVATILERLDARREPPRPPKEVNRDS